MKTIDNYLTEIKEECGKLGREIVVAERVFYSAIHNYMRKYPFKSDLYNSETFKQYDAFELVKYQKRMYKDAFSKTMDFLLFNEIPIQKEHQ